jgi:ABC-2 type transport system permease protein
MGMEILIENLRGERAQGRVGLLGKLRAFVRRDRKIWWTYKMWVTLDLLETFTFVITYALVSRIVSPERLVEAGYTAGGYLAFSVIGVAFQQYVFSSVLGLSEAIRDEQWFGTMETILSSPTSFRTFLFGEATFRFMIGTVFLSGALLLGVVLGAEFQISLATLLSVFILALLMIFSHVTIGIASAGVIMKIKQGNPVAWAFSWCTQLVSGVFYPLGVLPAYLQWVGRIFPLTYSLDGVRRCLMNGETLLDAVVAENVLWLLLFIVVALPISLFIFRLGYNSSRRDGSLGQY